MLNICFGLVNESVLKRTLKNEINFEVLNMDLLLNHGKINKLDSEKFRSALIFDDIPIQEIRDNFIKKIKNFTKVKIWYSTGDSQEYCNFLYTLSLIKENNANISIFGIDCYETKISKMDGTFYETRSIAERHIEEVKELLSKEAILSETKIKTFLNLWRKIVNENKLLRIIKNNKLISVDENYFDEKILYHLKNNNPENCRYGDLCGLLLSRYHLSDIFFSNRIDHLIRNRKIILVTKDQDRYYNSIIKLEEENINHDK